MSCIYIYESDIKYCEPSCMSFTLYWGCIRLTSTNCSGMQSTLVQWTACSDDASVASMAAEKAILCLLFEKFSKPDEIIINTCLILQNTLLQCYSHSIQNIREHLNQVKWFVASVVPFYCDPAFTTYFKMRKDNLFRWRIIHLSLRLL